MAKLTLIGDITTLDGTKRINPDIAGSSSIFTITTVVLASGANTITLPTPTTSVQGVIITPNDSSVTVTLKGISGDTGIAISNVLPTIIAFGSPQPTDITLTSSALAVSAWELSWY